LAGGYRLVVFVGLSWAAATWAAGGDPARRGAQV